MDNLDTALSLATPRNPVLLMGPPGVGKSARVEAWAKDTGKRLLIEHPVIAESVDYRGLPAVVDGEANWLPLGGLREICTPDGPDTVVLLDDVGQANGSVQAALMQLILARRLGDLKIRENVTFVLASNRVEDRAGARPMLSPLINRVMVVSVRADSEKWAEWAIGNPLIDPDGAAYLKFRPDSFVDAVPDTPMTPYCTPRSMAAMCELSAKGVTNLDMLGGWVGVSVAADYLAFKESVNQLPAIEVILKNPKITDGITDLGLKHAIVAQAARKSESMPQEIVDLANHLGGGWGLTLVSSAQAVWAGFKRTPAFKSWAIANKNYI